MKDNKKEVKDPKMAPASKKNKNLIDLETIEFHIRESYKAARTNIVYSIIKKGCKKISFTSVSKSEGKTITSVNIAIALAKQVNTKVLIIDCDLRRPQVHNLLSIEPTPGVTNFLNGECDKEAIIKPTKVENLFAVPCGAIPPNPSELLESSDMHDFIKNAEKEYDFIIFDTPPVGVVVDALPIVKQTDGVVLIVKHNHTTYPGLKRIVETLSRNNAKILGIVVNGVDTLKTGKGGKLFGGYDMDMAMDTVITADNRRCRFKTFSGRNNSMKEQEKYCIVNGVKYYVDEKKAYSVVKRVFDVAASLTALILFFWVFAIIALVIKLNDGGPVFYVSKRVGRFGKEFDFYKFRSMHVNAEEMLGDLLSQNETSGQLFKMKNDPRITRVGMFLRKTSLDELPQLFNILKGDMSFVGPRPPLVREVENYTEYSMQRLSVIGGLTCYWQISGRSEIDFNGMVKLDMQYISERSVLTDLKILFKTIPAVIKGDGAY